MIGIIMKLDLSKIILIQIWEYFYYIKKKKEKRKKDRKERVYRTIRINKLWKGIYKIKR